MPAVLEPPSPIAGVSPPELKETTIMTVWPSIAATGIGRFLGQLYAIDLGVSVFTVGNLIALLSIPIVLPLILGKFAVDFLAGVPILGLPFLPLKGSVQRYILTNRRVLIAEGLIPQPTQYVDLDRFDSIEVVVQPGQAWYPAGDLIFRKGNTETFRLAGVRRPETFRQTIMKARNGYVGVKKIMD
ncbi:MAG: PH domain-containing protein [Pirellulales bacterium]|nr:PH domain-containing protein [Pirellulales bacterium]